MNVKPRDRWRYCAYCLVDEHDHYADRPFLTLSGAPCACEVCGARKYADDANRAAS